MGSLIKIEWLKIRKYPAFWWMLGMVVLTYPGVSSIAYGAYDRMISNKEMMGVMARMMLGTPFSFPEVWHTVAYFSSVCVVLPAVLVIMLITNEFQYKTHRQNVIDGWTKNQFMTSKLIDVAIISLVTTAVYVAIALGYGFYTDASLASRMQEETKYIGLFFLQAFAQLSIAFLLGFLIRKAFIALGVLLFYFIVLENMVVGFLNAKKIANTQFFPLEISDRLIPQPAFFGRFGADAESAYNASVAAIPAHVGYTIVLTAVIWALCYRVHARRDL